MLPLADRDLTERLFAELLPGHGPIAALNVLAGGSVSGAYAVSFTDPDTPDVVVKIVPSHEAWMALKEAHSYRLFAEHGIGPIPRVLASAAGVAALDGGACTILSVLPGTSLGAVSAGLTHAQLRDIYTQLGALLARIHAVPMPAFGYIVTGIVHPSPDNATHMAAMFARNLREYRALGADAELADAIEATVSAHAAADAFAECAAASLCHGDFHEHNILVAEGPDGWHVSGLIDPANLHSGDPLIDLVRTDSFAVNGDPAKLAGLLAGYGLGGEQWPDAWQARMRLYRVLLALELRNWFTTRQPEAVPGLDRELRELTRS